MPALWPKLEQGTYVKRREAKDAEKRKGEPGQPLTKWSWIALPLSAFLRILCVCGQAGRFANPTLPRRDSVIELEQLHLAELDRMTLGLQADAAAIEDRHAAAGLDELLRVAVAVV